MNNFTKALAKLPSGIRGLDEITGGGLPKGRGSLVCGGAGSGKTLFALTYLVEGALKYGEPGVFMCFEENEEELAANIASLGYDLDSLIASKKLSVELCPCRTQRDRGDRRIRPRRPVRPARLRHRSRSAPSGWCCDTLEALFGGLSNAGVLRRRTAPSVPLAEGPGRHRRHHRRARRRALTRHGLEEYVSDCVIMLDQRVRNRWRPGGCGW